MRVVFPCNWGTPQPRARRVRSPPRRGRPAPHRRRSPLQVSTLQGGARPVQVHRKHVHPRAVREPSVRTWFRYTASPPSHALANAHRDTRAWTASGFYAPRTQRKPVGDSHLNDLSHNVDALGKATVATTARRNPQRYSNAFRSTVSRGVSPRALRFNVTGQSECAPPCRGLQACALTARRSDRPGHGTGGRAGPIRPPAATAGAWPSARIYC